MNTSVLTQYDTLDKLFNRLFDQELHSTSKPAKKSDAVTDQSTFIPVLVPTQLVDNKPLVLAASRVRPTVTVSKSSLNYAAILSEPCWQLLSCSIYIQHLLDSKQLRFGHLAATSSTQWLNLLAPEIQTHLYTKRLTVSAALKIGAFYDLSTIQQSALEHPDILALLKKDSLTLSQLMLLNQLQVTALTQSPSLRTALRQGRLSMRRFMRVPNLLLPDFLHSLEYRTVH